MESDKKGALTLIRLKVDLNFDFGIEGEKRRALLFWIFAKSIELFNKC